MSGISRIGSADRHRLDHALVEAGQKTDPVSANQIASFETALKRRSKPKPASGDLLRDEIEALTMPEIGDPEIFTTARSIDLLEHIIGALLPGLDLPDDVQAVSAEILEEEIARRREVQERLNAEGAGP